VSRLLICAAVVLLVLDLANAALVVSVCAIAAAQTPVHRDRTLRARLRDAIDERTESRLREQSAATGYRMNEPPIER